MMSEMLNLSRPQFPPLFNGDMAGLMFTLV